MGLELKQEHHEGHCESFHPPCCCFCCPSIPWRTSWSCCPWSSSSCWLSWPSSWPSFPPVCLQAIPGRTQKHYSVQGFWSFCCCLPCSNCPCCSRLPCPNCPCCSCLPCPNCPCCSSLPCPNCPCCSSLP